MKKIMHILAALVLAMLGGSLVFAGNVFCEADEESPILVKYVGGDTATITVNAGSVVLVDGSISNTNQFDGDDTVADLVTAVLSATNSSGYKNFRVAYWASLASDACDTNYLVTASATTITKTWNRVFKWDTSKCLHFDCVVNPGMGLDTPIGDVSVTRLHGLPAGTGDVILSLYVAGSREYLSYYPSPLYVTPSEINYTGTVSMTADTNVVVNVSIPEAIWIGAGSAGFVRAARKTTTGTPGGIGATFK